MSNRVVNASTSPQEPERPTVNGKLHGTPVTPPPTRKAFRKWLRKHRRLARTLTLSAPIHEFGEPISTPAAYRAALAEGLRGRRRYATRFTRFWQSINWSLPDTVLERVWGVARQNLRQRRRRQHVGPPRWRLPDHAGNPEFEAALNREARFAASRRGPRPN
jgi:hypothetical protein